MRDEEAKVRHAGAGERIDKQGEPEMRREVKAAKTCEEVADNGTPTAGQCKKGKCDTIGSTKICTDCAFNNEVPINGECKDVTQAPGSTFCTRYAAGLCSACKGASFMFKGGAISQVRYRDLHYVKRLLQEYVLPLPRTVTLSHQTLTTLTSLFLHVMIQTS